MKKILILSCFGLLALFYACKHDTIMSAKVKINFKTLDTGSVVLITEDATTETIITDTLKINNGEVMLEKNIAGVMLFQIVLANVGNKDVFILPGETQIVVKDSLLKEIVITGASDPINKLYEQYAEPVKKIFKESDSLVISYRNLQRPTPKDVMKVQEELDKLQMQKMLMDSNFIITHLDSKLTPFIVMVNYSSGQFNDAQVEKFRTMFTEEVKKSFYGQKLSKLIESTPAVGKKLKDISLPDTSGNPVALSSFKGKVLLVDFWASWCGPCREANPSYVKLYNEYHPLGLEMVGISLDADKQDWIEAIHEDKLPWIHISDLKKWDSEVVTKYNIKYIPYSILVDATGTVVFINADNKENELKKQIQKLLSKK